MGLLSEKPEKPLENQKMACMLDTWPQGLTPKTLKLTGNISPTALAVCHADNQSEARADP